MDDEANMIVKAYNSRYPEFAEVKVDELASNSFGGTLAAVSYKVNGQKMTERYASLPKMERFRYLARPLSL